MPPLPSRLLEALDDGWTIVTANQHSAREIAHALARRNVDLGLATWRPPEILAWDAWIAGIWHRLLLSGRSTALLLNRTQENALWRAVLDDDGDAAETGLGGNFLDALAETSTRAWRLLHAYVDGRRVRDAAGSADTRAFARWAREFERRCRDRGYLTQAELPKILRDASDAEELRLAAPGILLVGFDDKTPAQRALLDTLLDRGLSLDEIDAPAAGTGATLSLVAAMDEEQELAATARWARAFLVANPAASVALIVSDLEPQRARIDRAFHRILAPESEDLRASNEAAPYEFSLGVALAAVPTVGTALDLLRWTNSPLPLERISSLLLSPYFAVNVADRDAEYLARAEFDADALRQAPLLQPQISVDGLLALLDQSRQAARLPVLRRHLLQIMRQRRELAQATRGDALATRSFSAWAEVFTDLLEAAGWAPAAALDSVEFQARRKWESALDELSTLDFEVSAVSFETALAELSRIASGTLFAPESHRAPVQIMGPLEAAGSSFDAVWFLRASDLVWPPSPAANPLLPWHLQREAGMPGADPARDADLGRRITERIAGSAPTVVFSYAQQSAESHQRPSPALAGLGLTPVSVADIAPAEALFEPIALEAVEDATPIPPPPEVVLQGGAAILEAQAACQFRAFAEKRLWSAGLEDRTLGLDPRGRGTIVHAVLADFWGRIQTQQALRRMTEAQRLAELAQSVDFGLHKAASEATSNWDAAYLATERLRLLNLLTPWLEVELARPPFAVKLHEAPLADARIGPLRLSIRVDRVDLTLDAEGNPDGGEILIDYKTGATAPSDWLSDRPRQPQLPLYAVLSDADDLAAVAFAGIRPGEDMGMPGFEARPGLLPKPSGIKVGDLDAQREEWYRILTRLAEDFHAGEAHVSPLKYPGTCQYCAQRLLCRLDISGLNAEQSDGIADGGSPDAGGSFG